MCGRTASLNNYQSMDFTGQNEPIEVEIVLGALLGTAIEPLPFIYLLRHNCLRSDRLDLVFIPFSRQIGCF